jgi:phosphoglycerate dehydrogenase-like enzyme
VRAATDRGVLVINAPGANAPAVSEHAIGLMLALCRRIADTDRAAHRDHRVDPTRVMTIPPRPTLMSGKTLGVVGFGFIGRTLAQRCRSGFEMDMLAFDPYFDQLEAQRLGVTMVDELDELLEGSDFVSVNTPLTDATRHLIGAAELSRMKPTAFLINTARGPVIDTDALVGALTDRRIAGAGLDVTDPEPLPDGHALFDLENVVLTPHLGGNASELLRTCALTSARLALDALRGRRPQHLVNPAAWERHRERFGNQGAPMA